MPESMPNIEDLRRALDLQTPVPVSWQRFWPDFREYDAENAPGFPVESDVLQACRTLRMPEDVQRACRNAVQDMSRLPAVKRLYRFCVFLLRHKPGMLNADVPSWPMLPRHLGNTIPMFYALVFLGCLDHVRAIHQQRRIDWDVTLDTLSDLELWIREHKRVNGSWGFSEHKWLVQHFAANLFRLGRLQFQPDTFRLDFHAYRHRTTGSLKVLAGNGMTFTAEGLFVHPRQSRDAAGPLWQSQLVVDSERATGHPVTPTGTVLRNPLHLPLSDWQCVLKKGSPTIAMHIPATGPMTHRMCGESIQQAIAFFPQHFPELPFGALTCTSWLFDPQLDGILPETSNIVRFQREVLLLPLPGADDTQILRRVLGVSLADLHRAPRNTSLQRAVAAHIENGGHWRSGVALLFPDDLNWGSQVYRHRPSS